MKQRSYDWIHHTPDQMRNAADDALRTKRQVLEAIIVVPSHERIFSNTIAAFEYADEDLSDIQQQADLLVSVHPDANVRIAAQGVADHIDEENVAMEYDRRLWTAVQEWSMHREKLDDVDGKLADDTIRDMKRMGFELSDELFDELKTNTAQLRKLQTEFEKAINDWEDHIVLTRAELIGLPDTYIDGLTKDGVRYRVTLEYPDFIPFMRLSENDAARRALATKNLSKGGRGNLERLARMIQLRQKNARLLGYGTHADFVAEPRMSKSAEIIHSFLGRIIDGLLPAARKEMEGLNELKQQLSDAGGGTVQFHEVSYWSYKHYRSLFDLDSELVKEYFPTTHVVQQMLRFYQEVLSITFRPVSNVKMWHEDVMLYEVVDGEQTIGHFALDLFPRKGKFGHAAVFPVVLGRIRADGSVAEGFVALVCNFPKPTAGRVSLLTHDEVETLLHEFGHVCHALLSGGRWQSQNGFGVSQDFVEAMSQLFEEWAWEPGVLKRLTSHYLTGDTMPDAVMKKMISARHHMDSTMYLRQAVQALCDLQMHTQPTESEVFPQALADGYRSLRLKYEATQLPESSLFPAGWSHMADYDAGYYGYLWSKVYALDMYTRFAADPLNPAVGDAYRREVLMPGSSRDELEMVRSFLGREPSQLPFMNALGISE